MVATPRLSQYLRRFRPTAAPGAAAPAGVPADFASGLEAELAPVFAALGDASAEAERIRAAAKHEAQRRRAAVTTDVEQILAGSRREGAARRAEVASREIAQQAQEHEQLLAAAAAEVERVRDGAQQRLPEVVARVVGLVRSGVEGVATGAGAPEAGR